MPLLDHFHPPLKGSRHWEGFHTRWAAAIADALNDELLPKDYFAECQLHVGSSVEVDVGTFEKEEVTARSGADGGGTAVASRAYSPPATFAAMPARFPDDIEVQVYSERAGPTLVAAVELVSPANKDRKETRQAFAAKCAAYLQRGIGLLIVDIVTERRANLHDGLVRLLGNAARYRFPHDSRVYTTAYHPIRRGKQELIDTWVEPLAVGQPLPTMPLPVRGLSILPLDLEATYTEARQRSRLG
jgi:hypothetical protein